MNAGRINDIRLLGMISLLLIVGLAIVGMSWMTRVQYLLLVNYYKQTDRQTDFRLGLGEIESPISFVGNFLSTNYNK